LSVAAPPQRRWLEPSVLPGFRVTLGFTLFYLSLIVLIPLAALMARPWEHGLSGFWASISDPRVVSALRVSFSISAAAAAVNVVFGLVAAWVLVRYQFPGRRFIDAAIDLPFAIPTAVAGVALTTLYAPNGWIGEPLSHLGIKVSYTPLGIWVALVFVGLPFVVRSVQPVLQDFDAEVEEAATTLGAGPVQRWFGVILPSLMPSLLTGFTLAFARAVGEYGSVIFIAGNMPFKSEIVPLLIVNKLEQFDYSGAAAVGVIMLVFSFLALLVINFIQVRLVRRGGQ
jgi:sulfate transport system permease protein